MGEFLQSAGSWISQNPELFLTLVQTVAVLVAIPLALNQIKSGIKMNRASISLEFTNSHREIWSHLLTNQALERVLQEDVDVEANPPSYVEEYFVVMVTNHMSAVFDAYKEGLHRLYPNDMKDFYSMPVPHKVWRTIRDFQPKPFANYIDSLLADTSQQSKVDAEAAKSVAVPTEHDESASNL